MRLKWVAVLALGGSTLLGAARLPAEIIPPLDTPLRSDRPSAVPTAETLARGRFQGEAGLRAAWGDGRSSGRLGDLVMRFGAGERWELDLGFGAFRWREDASNGTTDGSLGIKLRLHDESEGRKPRLACRLSTTLPSGSRGNGGKRPGPEAVLIAAWRLSDRAELRGSLGVARRFDAAGRTDELSSGLLIELALADRWRAFTELVARAGDRDAVELTSGVGFLLFPDVRFDAQLIGSSGSAADFGAGAGVTVRW